MKKPMSEYRIDPAKHPPFEFKKNLKGLAYAEKGNIKTYANLAQAGKKLNSLLMQGHNVFIGTGFPFIIYKHENIMSIAEINKNVDYD